MAWSERLERASREWAGYRWCALVITTFCQAAAVSLNYVVGPLAPLLQAEFGASRAEIGLILTSVALSAVAIGLVGGRAADRVGERQVLIVSGLVGGLAALALAQAPSYWVFVAIFFVLGLGSGVQNPAGSAAVMRWFPPRLRGLAMGIRQTGAPLGGVLAATVWPAVAVAHGWRAAFVLGGLVTLVGALLILVGYFDPARPAGAERTRPPALGSLLARPELWWLGLTYCGQTIVQFCTSTYLVLFLHEVLGMAVVEAAALLALVNAVAVAARIAWGVLSDRQLGGARRPVLVAILLLTLGSMLTTAGLPADAPHQVVVGLAVLLGISAFAWTGIFGTLVIEAAGRESAATAIALVSTIGSPGRLLGPPLFGLLVDLTGSYRLAWLAAGAMVLAGLLAISRVRERPIRSAPAR